MILTPEQEEAWWQSHCAACNKEMPVRRRAACYECGHSWRWRWQLSLADARVYWGLGQCMGASDDWCVPWWKPWRRIHIRRPSKIYSCPCCSHDL